MIELLGADPISTVTTAGLSKFMSLLRRNPSKGYYDSDISSSRAYAATKRGMMIRESDTKNGIDGTKAYYFQFNPQTISDVKDSLYELRPYAGLPYNDYIWNGGGERNINFTLFLDNTPQSKTPEFVAERYNSVSANRLKVEGVVTKANTKDDRTTQIQVDPKYRYNYLDSFFNKQKIGAYEYTGNAYSATRVNEKGILDEANLIRSFMYPETVEGEYTPSFVEGGIVSSFQFRPPPIIMLQIGWIALYGLIKNAPMEYQLFDADLTPIRGKIDITFAVLEFMEYKENKNPVGNI